MRDTLQTTDAGTNQSGMFMIGMLCGAAMGAAIGLMLAPKAGSELRQQLWESTEDFRSRASSAYKGASGVVNDVIARGRQAVDAGRETFDRNRPGNGPATDITASMP